MRLPASAHTSRPWRIHELAPDFEVEDVWALPTPGGPDDFPRLVGLVAALEPARSAPPAVRALFEIRSRLGVLLGWDRSRTGGAAAEPAVLERVPSELRARAATRGAAIGQGFGAVPLYQTADEWALEIANRTVDGILHLGWVPEGDGYRGQMAILVKPNGLLGAAYMAAIRPFRHALVYPAMLREIARRWREG